MPALNISTDLRDPRVTTPIPKGNTVEGDIETIGRMPHGTTVGNSTVAVICTFREQVFTKDGREITHLFAETTLKLFACAHGAFMGAEQRQASQGGN